MSLKTLISIISLFFLSSCATSLVYSPSIGLTVKPLEKGEIDIKGAVILLPETRPNSIGKQTATGAEVHIAYGFTDKFALQLKGWADVQNWQSARTGYSLGGIKTVKEARKLRLLFMPRVGIAFSGSSIEGYGIETPLILQYAENANTSLFIGLGTAFGFRGLYKIDKNAGFLSGVNGKDEVYPFGFGALAHSGLVYRLTRHFRLNIELSAIYQLNTFDNQRHFLLSPNIVIGYTFDNKKKK